jgi:hypothetical protein
LAHRAIVAERNEGEKFNFEIAAGRLHPVRERWRRARIKRDEIRFLAGFYRSYAVV